MINLLPIAEKEKIISERKKKLIIIFWCLILFILISLTVILFAANFYLKAKAESQNIILKEVETAANNFQIKEQQKETAKINKEFKDLNYFYQNKKNFHEIVKKISELLPQEVYLKNFSVKIEGTASLGEKSFANIYLEGFCPNREILLDFKDTLSQEENFEDIYLPAADWTQSKNINFHISFKIK